MNILAVDTCLEPGSLALSCVDVSSSGEDHPVGESEVVVLPSGWRSVALHDEIHRLLARHDLTTENIDLYAVTAGPGAFTGVRLGLTAFKGLAEAHDKPLVPVSTLEVLAFSGVTWGHFAVTVGKKPGGTLFRVPSPSIIAPVFDARRGQVFAAVFKVTEAGEVPLEPIIPESVCSLRSFLDRIKSSGIGTGRQFLRLCVTDESLLLPAIEEFSWTADSIIKVSPQLAGTVARMAASRFREGKGTSALTADAMYVRASDAELFWKE